MGKFFGSKKAWSNPNYIVNLTTALVGKDTFREMGPRHPEWELDANMRQALTIIVAPQVRKMSVERLGKVCEYGTNEGIHRDCRLSEIPGFLNRTGFADVGGISFPSGISGRSMVEEIAITVIICIAFDIFMQAEWEQMRKEDQDHDKANNIPFRNPRIS